MKRKTIYVLMLICSLSMISFARQRCEVVCTDNAVARPASNSEADAVEPGKGYDLSPVGFFVLNM